MRKESEKAVSLAKYLLCTASIRESVNSFFFCSHSQVDRVRMFPYELNKDTLTFWQRGRCSPRPRCTLITSGSIFLVIIETKAMESKG